MLNKSRAISVFVALAFIFVLAGVAAQQATTQPKPAKETPQETVTCPVSGETMNKAEAKISWEYKGKTYYFCCEGCKAKFMKDPESFLQKKPEVKAEGKDVYVCPMCKDVKSDKPGKCPHCGMDMVKMEHGKDVFFYKSVEGPGEMMPGPMHGMMMPRAGMGREMMAGPGMGRPMMGLLRMIAKDIDFKVEYAKDGAVLTVTSKNPDTAKIIQGFAALLKTHWQSACREQMIKKEVVIKVEPKKETVQK